MWSCLRLTANVYEHWSLPHISKAPVWVELIHLSNRANTGREAQQAAVRDEWRVLNLWLSCSKDICHFDPGEFITTIRQTDFPASTASEQAYRSELQITNLWQRRLCIFLCLFSQVRFITPCPYLWMVMVQKVRGHCTSVCSWVHLNVLALFSTVSPETFFNLHIR